MATDKEVEAAAKALYECEMKRADHAQQTLEQAAGRELPGAREREAFDEHADSTWRKDARAALTAAEQVRASEQNRMKLVPVEPTNSQVIAALEWSQE